MGPLQGNAGLLPSYICNLIIQRLVDFYGLRSIDQLLLSVPFAHTELGKKGFHLLCSFYMEHAAKRLENN